jgi:hypothetical protein
MLRRSCLSRNLHQSRVSRQIDQRRRVKTDETRDARFGVGDDPRPRGAKLLDRIRGKSLASLENERDPKNYACP